MNLVSTQTIIVFGMASNSTIKEIPIPKQIPDNLSLMDFLRQNFITLASSCNGEGTCKKCIVNKELISCQKTLKNFILENPKALIQISYL